MAPELPIVTMRTAAVLDGWMDGWMEGKTEGGRNEWREEWREGGVDRGRE